MATKSKVGKKEQDFILEPAPVTYILIVQFWKGKK